MRYLHPPHVAVLSRDIPSKAWCLACGHPSSIMLGLFTPGQDARDYLLPWLPAPGGRLPGRDHDAAGLCLTCMSRRQSRAHHLLQFLPGAWPLDPPNVVTFSDCVVAGQTVEVGRATYPMCRCAASGPRVAAKVPLHPNRVVT